MQEKSNIGPEQMLGASLDLIARLVQGFAERGKTFEQMVREYIIRIITRAIESQWETYSSILKGVYAGGDVVDMTDAVDDGITMSIISGKSIAESLADALSFEDLQFGLQALRKNLPEEFTIHQVLRKGAAVYDQVIEENMQEHGEEHMPAGGVAEKPFETICEISMLSFLQLQRKHIVLRGVDLSIVKSMVERFAGDFGRGALPFLIHGIRIVQKKQQRDPQGKVVPYVNVSREGQGERILEIHRSLLDALSGKQSRGDVAWEHLYIAFELSLYYQFVRCVWSFVGFGPGWNQEDKIMREIMTSYLTIKYGIQIEEQGRLCTFEIKKLGDIITKVVTPLWKVGFEHISFRVMQPLYELIFMGRTGNDAGNDASIFSTVFAQLMRDPTLDVLIKSPSFREYWDKFVAVSRERSLEVTYHIAFHLAQMMVPEFVAFGHVQQLYKISSSDLHEFLGTIHDDEGTLQAAA